MMCTIYFASLKENTKKWITKNLTRTVYGGMPGTHSTHITTLTGSFPSPGFASPDTKKKKANSMQADKKYNNNASKTMSRALI
jgi:hypothetical protein